MTEGESFFNLNFSLTFSFFLRIHRGNTYAPITARFGTFSQLSLFLCQLALVTTEDQAADMLGKIIKEIQQFDSLEFGDFKHTISVKCVLDYAALWKTIDRNKIEVMSGNTEEIKFRVLSDSERSYKGCPYCCGRRFCVASKQHGRNLNFLKSENKEECLDCYNRYSNFGVFEFNPNIFHYLAGLPNSCFLPCTIHMIKNVTFRLLLPFASACKEMTKDFLKFNKVCDSVFGKKVVVAS